MEYGKVMVDGPAEAAAVNRFVEIGTPLFVGTGLTDPSLPIGRAEVGAVRRFIHDIAPPTAENQALHDHLELVAIFARGLGGKLKDTHPQEFESLNLDELEVLGLFHDMGRFITHRFYRNEVLERHVLRESGVRPDIIANNPLVSFSFKRKGFTDAEVQKTLDDWSPEARITVLADFCGKPTDDGGIRTFDEVMDYHINSRRNYEERTGLKTEWPSERTLDPPVVDFSARVYERLRYWAVRKGADPAIVRTDLLAGNVT